MPAYTFPATANVVALAGLKPVLVDVDPETMNIDPAQIEVGPRTKALLAVHLFGRPLPLHELPDVPLLEDAAGALGARVPRPRVRRPRRRRLPQLPPAQDRHDRRGRRRDDERRPRSPTRSGCCGTTAGARSRPPTCPCPGSTTASRTSSAPSGSRSCAASTSCSRPRTRIAAGYSERLAHLPVLLPRADEGDVHGWQAYVIQVDDRDRVLAELRAQGIEAQIGTYSLPLLGAYRDQGEFPGAGRVFERALALPFHTRLSEDELDRVAEALGALLAG